MQSVFLAPHNDDETLFGSFTILRHRPLVLICLKARIQELRGTGGTAIQREHETSRALWWLGDPKWRQLQASDVDPDWDLVEHELRALPASVERVFAPAVEDNGHIQHNALGALAFEVFGHRVEPYLTYRRGEGRSRGREVPYEPLWPGQKMRAMSCYETQIQEASTAPWFLDHGLREYTP